MSTAVTTKIVALGAVGSFMAQQAAWGFTKLRESLPSVELAWSHPVVQTVEPAAEAVVEATTSVVKTTVGAAIDIAGGGRALAAFGLGMATTGVAIYGYNRVARNYPKRGGCWIAGGRNPETRVEGSEERVTLEPPFAVRVAFKNKRGEYTMTGWGYRSDYNGRTYLITAQHCLSSEVSEVYLRKGDKFFSVAIDQYEILCNDAVLIPVPENVFARLCVRKPKYGIVPEMGQAVTVLGLEGKGTTGLLENESGRGSFGRVLYRGTTMGGYSGSPYYSGNVIYGMHTNGGHYNGGYNAMYLHVKAKIVTDEPEMVAESPRLLDDWFDESGETFEVEWEGDWAVVQHQTGKYVRIRKDDYYAAEARWMDRSDRRAYEDLEDQENRRAEYEREYESAQVPVQPPPPPQQQAITLTIPAPSSSGPAVSGNGPTPGTSRGGNVSEQQRPLETENRRESTNESFRPSPAWQEVVPRRFKKHTPSHRSTGSQTVQNVSTKPSKSTRKTGSKH